MQTPDFFRRRIDAMLNLNDPLAVLAPRFEHQDRAGQTVQSHDLFGPAQGMMGAGHSAAGRPKLPIRLMTSLLYLKHSFNLSDEELVVRAACAGSGAYGQGAT